MNTLTVPAGKQTKSPARSLTPRTRLFAEAAVIFYITAVAALARYSGIPYLLFPELGALAYDVLLRPWGKWASQPVRLILTPALTALLGTIVTRHLPFNGLTVVLVSVLSAAVITVLRSTIVPAMSAGVLPLVLGLKSWLYPPSILLTLTALAVISILWRKYHDADPAAAGTAPDVEDVLESVPHGRFWSLILIAFVFVMAEAARLTGLRLIIFPPLVTMAFEMFGHHETCPWSKRPLTLPAMCLVVSLGGLLAFHFVGNGIAFAVIAVIIGIVALRSFDLHIPPAMAVGLLPSVIAFPTIKFPLAVLLGTSALTVSFLAYQRLARGSAKI
jgi:hypothetical protein